MKRVLMTFVICFSVFGTLSAQNEQAQINDIKRSLDFLYVTGTSTRSVEEASANALELLSLEIEQWLQEKGTGDFTGYIAKSKQNVSEIKTKRGSLNRVFAYVKKNDILPYKDEESVMVVTTHEEVATAPIDSISIVTVVPDSSDVKQEDNNSKVSAEIESVTQQAVQHPTFEPNAEEKKMLLIRDLSQINKYIADGSREGIVGSYGKYDTNTRLFGMSYLYVFDRDKVLAVLRKTGDTIINLSTGQDDAVSNYGRCGVVWFQLKEK